GVATRHLFAEGRARGQHDVDELRRDGQPLDRPGVASALRLSCDHPDAGPVFRLRLGESIALEVAVLRATHLVARRQVEPELQARDALRAHLRHLLVEDAAVRAPALAVAGASVARWTARGAVRGLG